MNFNFGGSAFDGGALGGVNGCGALGNGALFDPFSAASLMSSLNYDANYFWWYDQKYGQSPSGPVNADRIRHHPYHQSLLQQQQRQNKKINLTPIGGYLGQHPPHLSLYPTMPPTTGQAGQYSAEVMLDILRAQQQILAAQYANLPALTQPLTNVQQCQPPPFDQNLYNFILQQQIFRSNISINLQLENLKSQLPFQKNGNSRFTAPLKVCTSTQKPHSAKFPKSFFHQKTVTVPPPFANNQASFRLPYQQWPNANFGMVQTSMSELYIAGAAKTKMNR